MSVMTSPPPWHMPLMAMTTVLDSGSSCTKGVRSRPSVSAIERLAALVLAAHLAADAEGVARARHDEHVDLGVALRDHRGLLQTVVHLDGAGVLPLGPIDDDAEHAPLLRRTQARRTEIDRRHPSVLAARPTRMPAARPSVARL